MTCIEAIITFAITILGGAAGAVFTYSYHAKKKREALKREYPNESILELLRQIGSSTSTIRIIRRTRDEMELLFDGQWHRIRYDLEAYSYLRTRGFVRDNVDATQETYFVHGLTELGYQKAKELLEAFGRSSPPNTFPEYAMNTKA